MVTDGYRKKKNWSRPGMMIAQMRPTNHARKVAQGMSGSSVLATAERTSGYGESSSAVQELASRELGGIPGREERVLTEVLGVVCQVRVVKVRSRNDIWVKEGVKVRSANGVGGTRHGRVELTVGLLRVKLLLGLVDRGGRRHGGPDGAGRRAYSWNRAGMAL